MRSRTSGFPPECLGRQGRGSRGLCTIPKVHRGRVHAVRGALMAAVAAAPKAHAGDQVVNGSLLVETPALVSSSIQQ